MTSIEVEIQERHKAFHSKIAAQARPDPGISCPSASGRIPAHEAPPPGPSADDIARWAERQKAIPIPVEEPKEPWFSIIAEMGPPPPITIRQVISAVSAECGISRNDILSARRTADIAMARQISMYLAKDMTGFSFPALGRQFGYRDHTTVLHGVRKIERLRGIDADVNALVVRVKNKINDDHNARFLKTGVTT